MKELRVLAAVLACLCIFAVVGCSSDDSSSDNQTETQPAEPGGPVPEGNN